MQSSCVNQALLGLLGDENPNNRAVAAISLGRIGIQEDYVINRLINLLTDKDRIVRQSTCLALGSIKATSAIPHLSNVWYETSHVLHLFNLLNFFIIRRNDYINVVRDTARAALRKMQVPTALGVLRVTDILEAEIDHLSGLV